MEKIIHKEDISYPRQFCNLDDMPNKIYCYGDVSLLNSPCISVVGSRKCTCYGAKVAEEIGALLGQNGVTVVSGMAKGIDAAAHRGAIKSGGKTIAILGNGIDICYPNSNRDIYNEVKNSGLLVSEYENGFVGRKYTFPRRNRLISAISMATIVVEAPRRSGALITAEYAIEQGREIYAVPGNISSFFSFGSNMLIRDGARALICLEDILHDFNIEIKSKEIEKIELSSEEKNIYKIVRKLGEASMDEICQATEMNSGRLAGILTVLELKGLIYMEMGKFFVEKF